MAQTVRSQTASLLTRAEGTVPVYQGSPQSQAPWMPRLMLKHRLDVRRLKHRQDLPQPMPPPLMTLRLQLLLMTLRRAPLLMKASARRRRPLDHL